MYVNIFFYIFDFCTKKCAVFISVCTKYKRNHKDNLKKNDPIPT